ncbi:hypothetical protein BLNAU_6185 [Blattamonas nauphoetae]|uniref:Uncharacterized protein n=1 Tax=Blattamonas nauphoetae TaxID=2049346 RepID=A0ABQ9Y5C3_9EUKA|nr:hypothetical protein BLNAU_6185 [Blattamonas nauphoetae]
MIASDSIPIFPHFVVVNPEYSPFLDLNPEDPVTVDSVAQPVLSLISMVRDGHIQNLARSHRNVCGFDGCAPVLVLSIDISGDTLLRNLSVIDDQVILQGVLEILHFAYGLSSTFTVPSLSINHNTDTQSIRDVFLHEVFIPTEPSLLQISRNRSLVHSVDH